MNAMELGASREIGLPHFYRRGRTVLAAASQRLSRPESPALRYHLIY
jgi:hypothetical protein